MDVKLGQQTHKKGFTLVELLVVISIIAMLLAVLMPALSKAKKLAQGVVCAAHMRGIGTGMLAYVTEFQYFPASYLYPSNATGGYSTLNQDPGHPYGYLHWSWYLFNSGKVDGKLFSCPAMKGGGAPRTNPGPRQEDWEKGQQDQGGQSSPNSLMDKQAPRISITANAVIIPRNKFTSLLAGGGQRVNRFVNGGELRNPSSLIMATEFNNNWKALGNEQGSGVLVKSHRPILAFSHTGTGYKDNAVYQAPLNTPYYVYGDNNATRNFGLKPIKEVEQSTDLLDGGAGHPINAVGRHHSGSGSTKEFGGCANFIYVDGHVARKSILQTLEAREWGTKFYSITGRNDVK
ncbi:MAG: prepilin-type N-terminal cleavage/methylation domain-containing protein [Planctomycetaceae bacterium]|nr:prepilin-type N-terminal cleavage/methylation domain-containing protein [Planctomycetaceae bacterium]